MGRPAPVTTEPASNVYAPLVEEIVGGRRNIFLTGRAGTGKTTLLRQLIFNSLEKAVVPNVEHVVEAIRELLTE